MLEIVLNFNAKMLSFKIRKKSSINLELKLVNSALGHINVSFSEEIKQPLGQIKINHF